MAQGVKIRRNAGQSAGQDAQQQAYQALLQAIDQLASAAKSCRGFANSMLKKLTQRVINITKDINK